MLRKLKQMEHKRSVDIRPQGQDSDGEGGQCFDGPSNESLYQRDDYDGRDRQAGEGRGQYYRRRGDRRVAWGSQRHVRTDAVYQADESNKENADMYNDDGVEGVNYEQQPVRYRSRRFRRVRPPPVESAFVDGVDDNVAYDNEQQDGAVEPRRGQRRRHLEPRGDSHENVVGMEYGRPGSGNRGYRVERLRRNRLPPANPDGVVFVGSISRSVRVSHFKCEMKGCGVHPLRLVWKGGRGFAFLHFTSADDAGTAVKAMSGLEIDGKQLNIEPARQNSTRRQPARPDDLATAGTEVYKYGEADREG